MDENNHYYEEFDNMRFETDDEAEDDAIVELVALFLKSTSKFQKS